ncbi:membrane protein [Kiloniella spongiae]|uniref:Membrane protein n=1 Tax=Kiloniella spongiae TaxID=1489064 RepID=A0A0H2MHQ3_9PROT|nr:MFS transporter [Kiloniella spongiae]KLN61716.1 membrane protein [Kiloniella spongiae]
MPFKNNFFRSYGFWHWGEGFQTVLFTWYMTFHADLTATEIGFFQGLVLSPFLIFTIAGGALTDKVGASISYVISTCLFGVILIAYGILDHSYGYVFELFFAYCLLAGIVSAVSNPAIDTFIPEASSLPVQENSLLAATAHNLAKLTGTVTGLLLPFLIAVGGFIANGILMLISVLFLLLHLKQKKKAQKGSQQNRSEQKGKVSRFVFHRIFSHYRKCPENFDILLSSGLQGLLIVPTGYILWPLIMREQFPEYGDYIAVANICGWIGAITATTIAKRYSYRIIKPGLVSLMTWGGYACGVFLLLFVDSFTALCLLVMVFGSTNVGKALVYGKYMHNSPNDERGVLIAVDQTAFWGLATFGTFGLGVLVDTIGLNSTIILTASSILLGVIGLICRGNLLLMKPT